MLLHSLKAIEGTCELNRPNSKKIILKMVLALKVVPREGM
jgi:hypothetical protein